MGNKHTNVSDTVGTEICNKHYTTTSTTNISSEKEFSLNTTGRISSNKVKVLPGLDFEVVRIDYVSGPDIPTHYSVIVRHSQDVPDMAIYVVLPSSMYDEAYINEHLFLFNDETKKVEMNALHLVETTVK